MSTLVRSQSISIPINLVKEILTMGGVIECHDDITMRQNDMDVGMEVMVYHC